MDEPRGYHTERSERKADIIQRHLHVASKTWPTNTPVEQKQAENRLGVAWGEKAGREDWEFGIGERKLLPTEQINRPYRTAQGAMPDILWSATTEKDVEKNAMYSGAALLYSGN